MEVRADANTDLRAENIFWKIPENLRADTDLRSSAEKAVSGVFSKKDDSASGYSWFAREP
jgi:hypothetical protein